MHRSYTSCMPVITLYILRIFYDVFYGCKIYISGVAADMTAL